MNGPGKSFRVGVTLMQICDMFPDDAAAERWFVSARWPDGVQCVHCDSNKVSESQHPQMRFRCRACDKHFSVKTKSVMHASKVGYRKWLVAIYLLTTNLKGVSSMKLHRDIGVTQKTAWHMAHRIREALLRETGTLFGGPVEVDEKYVGGLEKNKHEKNKLHAGRGAVGKMPVVGILDRETNQIEAQTVKRTDKDTLQGFVTRRTEEGAWVFTDEARAYSGIDRPHETVAHTVGEYVRGMAHTNGLESFWSMLQRGYVGIYHWMSDKHLTRYVTEFYGRHNHRPLNTWQQMMAVVQGAVGRRLRYIDLIGPPHMRLGGAPSTM